MTNPSSARCESHRNRTMRHRRPFFAAASSALRSVHATARLDRRRLHPSHGSPYGPVLLGYRDARRVRSPRAGAGRKGAPVAAHRKGSRRIILRTHTSLQLRDALSPLTTIPLCCIVVSLFLRVPWPKSTRKNARAALFNFFSQLTALPLRDSCVAIATSQQFSVVIQSF